MSSLAAAIDIGMAEDHPPPVGRGYFEEAQTEGFTDDQANAPNGAASLGQRLSDSLALLLWIVIFLHPILLIALSFHWGLL